MQMKGVIILFFINKNYYLTINTIKVMIFKHQ